MEFYVCSDLHLEFPKNRAGVLKHIREVAENVIIAGDLDNFEGIRESVELMNRYGFNRVIHVAGNHEFFKGQFFEVITQLRNLNDKYSYFDSLYRDSIKINGHVIAGCPLWYAASKESPAPFRTPNEFNLCEGFQSNIWSEKEQDNQFVENEIQSTDVVITHYSPVPVKIGGIYGILCDITKMYPWIHNDVSLNQLKKGACWIHGHIHSNKIQYRSPRPDINIISNPLGYFKKKCDECYIKIGG